MSNVRTYVRTWKCYIVQTQTLQKFLQRRQIISILVSCRRSTREQVITSRDRCHARQLQSSKELNIVTELHPQVHPHTYVRTRVHP